MTETDAIMVHLWRFDQHKITRVFYGKGEVKMFMFYIENVAMGVKYEEEKHLELLVHLYGDALELFFERFTTEGTLT